MLWPVSFGENWYSKVYAGHSLKKLIYIKHFFEKEIPVTSYQPGCLFTAKAKANLIYKKFFERISIWNQKYDYKPGENDEFSGIQTIDKLYEKFCLFKIIDIITDLGYELIKSDNNKFIFSDTEKTIELFYELDFSTGKNSYGYMSVEKWFPNLSRTPYSHRVPDFSLFIEDNSKNKDLYIFDANIQTPEVRLIYT